MKKIIKIIVFIGAATIILLLILYQTGTFNTALIEPGETDSKTTPRHGGTVFELHEREIPVIYKNIGTVRSRDEIELAPRIIARIQEITRREGDTAKKGDVLVRLDNSDLEAAEQQAQERLNSALASLKRAEQDYHRQKLLLEKDVIPRKSFEQAEEVWKSAAAAVNAAEQARQQARVNLSYATIVSPMDGIVADRFNDPGDLASPGNIILKLFDPTRLMLYVPLRESLVKSVKIGDKINFRVEALQQNFVGEVREIVPSVDPGSRTFLVKTCILDEYPGLMPGMFGTISLQLDKEKAWLVPENALTRIGQLEYLTMADEDGSSSRLMVRTTPSPKPGFLKIISGVNAPLKIIIPGNNHD